MTDAVQEQAQETVPNPVPESIPDSVQDTVRELMPGEESSALTVIEAGADDSRPRMYPTWPPEMTKVSYVGAFLYPTGYGEACRSHARALKRVGVGLMAHLNQMPDPGLANELVKDDHEINEMLDVKFWPKEKEDRDPHAWVWHVTPDEFRRAEGKVNLGYAVWETAGLPQGWAEACNRMDGLLTASEFCADLFRKGGVTVPIAVCPHPIDLQRFHPEIDGEGLRATFGDVKTLFLVVSQWMFRKGVEDVVNAFASEFRHDEPVGLVLLVWRWSHAVKERNAVHGYTQFLLRGLNLPRGRHPRVWYLGEKLPPSALPVLYSACDAYISASRGEAFGLPIFEAAACGKPSIITGWGGMWDYLTDESAYRVAYDMETVHGAGPRWRHYDATQKWAKPRIDDLRRAMREVHEDVEGRKRKGGAAFTTVAERLAVPVAGKVMLDNIRAMVDTSSPKG